MYSFVACYRDGKVWVSLGSDFHVETGTANVPIDIGMSPPAPKSRGSDDPPGPLRRPLERSDLF